MRSVDSLGVNSFNLPTILWGRYPLGSLPSPSLFPPAWLIPPLVPWKSFSSLQGPAMSHKLEERLLDLSQPSWPLFSLISSHCHVVISLDGVYCALFHKILRPFRTKITLQNHKRLGLEVVLDIFSSNTPFYTWINKSLQRQNMFYFVFRDFLYWMGT